MSSIKGEAAPETVSALGVPVSEISSNLMPSMVATPRLIGKIVAGSEESDLVAERDRWAARVKLLESRLDRISRIAAGLERA